jgi:hypothetical protein
VSELEEDRGQGEVEPDAARQEPRGGGLAPGSLMCSQSALGVYLRRQPSRLGAPKAIMATAHKLARIFYHLVRYGVAYVQETEAAYAEPVRARLEKQLRRWARELGYEWHKIERPVTPQVETGAPPVEAGT